MNEEEIARKLDKIEHSLNEESLGFLIESIEQGTQLIREIAFEKLRKFRIPQAPKKVAQLLRSQDASIRNAATLVLGDLWDLSKEVLSELVHDQDKDVRKLALDALHCVTQDPLVVDMIAEALKDEDINNIIAAVEYIGELGGSQYSRAVLELLKESDNEFLCSVCLKTLAQIGDEECAKSVWNLYKKNLGNLDDITLISLFRLMSSFPQVVDIDSVIEITSQKWQLIIKEAIDLFSIYLEMKLPLNDEQKQRMIGLFKEMLSSDIPSMNKYEVLILLARLDPAMTQKELVNHLYGKDTLMQIAAVELIAQMNLKEYTDDIERIASTTEDEDLKIAAQLTLEQLKGEQ